MGTITKFEGKKEMVYKRSIPKQNPIHRYAATLRATSEIVDEIGGELLTYMRESASEAGLDFEKFEWIPENLYSPEEDVIHTEYLWKTANGTEYHILGTAEIYNEDYDMKVSLSRIIPNKTVSSYDFDKCQWDQLVDIAEQNRIQTLIKKDPDSTDILMEIRDYKEKFTEKDIAFYRKQYQKMIELYSKVSEFMMPVYDSDTETLFIDIFDPNRHGFTVTWNENEYQLEQYLIVDDLVQDDDINCFLLPQYVKPLRQVIWSGTDTDKLAAFLEKMGNRVAITDVYTCPISIETYVEFKKLNMLDLVVHGNNELTDLEKTNLKRLKNGIRKMLKSINQN